VPPEACVYLDDLASTSNRRAPLACERSRSAIRHRHRELQAIVGIPCATDGQAAAPKLAGKSAGKPVGRPITAKYLQNAAMFYLERYSASAEGVRRVLQRRVRKARRLEAPVMDDVEGASRPRSQKLIDVGLIDDRQFARPRHGHCMAGTSARFTRQKLQVAGVDSETVQSALALSEVSWGRCRRA